MGPVLRHKMVALLSCIDVCLPRAGCVLVVLANNIELIATVEEAPFLPESMDLNVKSCALWLASAWFDRILKRYLCIVLPLFCLDSFGAKYSIPHGTGAIFRNGLSFDQGAGGWLWLGKYMPSQRSRWTCV